MLNDLTTAMGNISPEDLEKMFAEPDATSNTIVDDPNKIDKNNPKVGGASGLNIDQVEGIEDFLGGKADTSGTSGTSGAASTSGTEGISGQLDTSGTSGTAATASTSGTSVAPPDPQATEQVSEILTNTVKFLVEKGLFKDFEGREDLKFTEEVYADLVEQQIEAIVNERYDSKKKSAGEYGQAIIDYIEKGGDADEVIDLFKEQRAIQEFDISTDESRKELITKFYKEAHGWKTDKIKKFVDGLIGEEGALEAEATDIKGKYDLSYKQQLQQLREQQTQLQQEQERRNKAFETNISSTIDKAKDLDDTRKKLIKDSLFKPKKLNDGTIANDMYVKLAQIQTDPNEYIEFTEFVMDKKGYLKRKQIEFQNTAVDKKFQFVKGGAAIDKNKGSNHQEPENRPDPKKHVGTDFKFALQSR